MPRGRPQISQKLIASEAGVSQATVSLILSGRDASSEGTRKRVLKTAERLKYRPNLLVHGIRTGKTRMIGVMAPPFDSFWSDVLYGIHDVLTENDHVPIILWTNHTGRPGHRPISGPGHELEQIHRLLDRRVDGVILWPPFASTFSDHVHEFSSRDLPVVTIDHRLPPEFRSDCVASDEALGGRIAAEYLLSKGHRNLAHLAGNQMATWAVERRRAFEERLKDEPGVTCRTLEAPPGEDYEPAMPMARELVSGKNRPTAIFCACDLLAKQVYRAASEAGLRIPEDISVVGFADDNFAAEMSPPLTTIRQHGYEIGRKAADLALGRTSGTVRQAAPMLVRLPVELVQRSSVRQIAGSQARMS